jgi:hypothetical protein
VPGQPLDPTDPPRPDEPGRPKLALILAGAGAVVLLIGLWIRSATSPAPTTTPASTTSLSLPVTTASTTSSAPATTTTTLESTTTTGAAQTRFDVIVVGDGLGGSTAAIVSARLGASTLLVSPTGYFGGQAGGAGVSTMDEGGNRYFFRRSGIYQELVDFVTFRYGSQGTGDCYFIDDAMCPEPSVVDEFFRNTLGTTGVTVVTPGPITDVVQDSNTVTGLIANGLEYQSKVLIDATEFSDLYPLIEGLDYQVGDSSGCVQDTTWLAIRSWYQASAPEFLIPPQDAIEHLRAIHGDEVDGWLEFFRTKVVANNDSPDALPWDFDTETAYRALADSRAGLIGTEVPEVTRTGVNYANDAPLTTGAIEDPVVREREFRRALHVTYAFLWYLRWELGVTDWGVSNDMRYAGATRLLWDDIIPDDLESNLPPIPYVREARRLIATYNLGPADLDDSVRERHRFDDAVMLGGYFTDFHGCQPVEGLSGYGLFEVPIGVFIPAAIDGFLPGLARDAGVSREASAALRTQPEEMWGGQVAGTIAGLAARDNIAPRQVSASQVQQRLLQTDLVFFLPG